MRKYLVYLISAFCILIFSFSVLHAKTRKNTKRKNNRYEYVEKTLPNINNLQGYIDYLKRKGKKVFEHSLSGLNFSIYKYEFLDFKEAKISFARVYDKSGYGNTLRVEIPIDSKEEGFVSLVVLKCAIIDKYGEPMFEDVFGEDDNKTLSNSLWYIKISGKRTGYIMCDLKENEDYISSETENLEDCYKLQSNYIASILMVESNFN